MSQTIEHIGSHHAHEPKRGHMRAGVYRGKGRVVVESVPIPEIGEVNCCFVWRRAGFAARTSRKFITALFRRRKYSGTSWLARW